MRSSLDLRPNTRGQPIVQRPLEDLISLLAKAGADFVVVGGLAVIFNGGSHLTEDADFAIIRRRSNAKVIALALAPHHPRPVNFPEDLPFVWDDETIMRSSVLTLETDLGRVDLLAEPSGAPEYEELKARSIVVNVKGHPVHVACVDDLLAMKRAAGRTKDQAHIAELESIQRILDEGT